MPIKTVARARARTRTVTPLALIRVNASRSAARTLDMQTRASG
jgi:hypothetical protein